MKYFMLVIVIFFQFLNFSYGNHPSVFCDPSFLKSATPQNLTDVLANMQYDNRKQGWRQKIFYDRDSAVRVAFLQTCNELGDTPLHVAARVGARFDTIDMLIQEGKERYPGPLPLSRILLRRNAESQTPFEILRNGLTQELSIGTADDLDTLLELYIMQDIAQQDVLIK